MYRSVLLVDIDHDGSWCPYTAENSTMQGLSTSWSVVSQVDCKSCFFIISIYLITVVSSFLRVKTNFVPTFLCSLVKWCSMPSFFSTEMFHIAFEWFLSKYFAWILSILMAQHVDNSLPVIRRWWWIEEWDVFLKDYKAI